MAAYVLKLTQSREAIFIRVIKTTQMKERSMNHIRKSGPSESRMAEFLTRALEKLGPGRTLASVAAEIGYINPATVLLFCNGEAKVPLDKTPALANAIGADPSFFFCLALEQYAPSLSAFVAEAMGRTVSENEYRLISCLRVMTGNLDPEYSPDVAEALATAVLGGELPSR